MSRGPYKLVKEPVKWKRTRRSRHSVAPEKLQLECAREGCDKQTSYPIPPDWRNMIVFWSPYPETDKTIVEICCAPTCDRDAVLCPEHAQELEAGLKDIGRVSLIPH